MKLIFKHAIVTLATLFLAVATLVAAGFTNLYNFDYSVGYGPWSEVVLAGLAC